MKIRSLALLAAISAMLAPSLSQADEHSLCDSPIYIFSRTRVQTDVDDPTTPAPDPIGRNVPGAVSSVVGCTTIHDTVQPGPGFEYVEDTDLIYPGSNRLEVRLLENGRDPSALTVATLTIGDEVIDLIGRMRAGVDVAGAPSPWLDSDSIVIDPTITLGPLLVTAHLCLDAGDAEDLCFDRTYRTVASQPLPA